MSDVPTDPEADHASDRVYALIVNGVTRAGVANDQDWLPLSSRERVAAAVYDELRNGGVEVRLTETP